MKRAPSPRRRKPAKPPPGKRLALLFVLLVVAVASGIQVVLTSHRLSEIHRLLEVTRQHQDDLLEEHTRLLLERATQARYQHVEHVARTELGMRYTNDMERI